LEPALLFFLSNFHPVLDDNHPGVNHIPFGNRAEFQEFLMLFRGAETHHVFHAGAVLPASVESYDLPCSGKILHITLEIHLRFFTIGRRRQCNQAKYARTHSLGNCEIVPPFPAASRPSKIMMTRRPLYLTQF
jgi:hypothetical protein